MKSYKIIEINENSTIADGDIIIVKANEIKMFHGMGAIYNMQEDIDTKIFIFPFSDFQAERLVNIAEAGDTEHNFWTPNFDDFYESTIYEDNELKNIYKHKSFIPPIQIRRYGIEGIVDAFHSSNVLNECYKDESNITKVKNVYLSEGTVYSGNALQIGSLCIPNGFGVKRFKNGEIERVASYFKDGKTGKIARIEYSDKCYFGGVIDEQPNGWGFWLAKGHITFGYYRDGLLYRDLTPYIMDVYQEMHFIGGLRSDSVNGEINRLTIGISPDEQTAFVGFQFFEDGSVYVGINNNKDEYDITGRFLKLEIDGKATLGMFKNGVVEKQINIKDYYDFNPSVSQGIGRLDLTSDYLAESDDNLYLIIAMGTTFDFYMGPIISIEALPFSALKMREDDHIPVDSNKLEFFYLHSEKTIAQEFYEKTQSRQLWIVNIDDFHMKHLEDAWSPELQKCVSRNVHIHNALIGFDYTDVANFDTVDTKMRLKFLNEIRDDEEF